MSDIPIIFSAPMVRALLEGRKTMTRRLATRSYVPRRFKNADVHAIEIASPWQRVKPGDRLWVREGLLRSPEHHWRYAADGTVIILLRTDPRVSAMIAWAHHKEGDNAPSIHMPRWASRLTLIVVATKIERLQKISDADAVAEGCAGTLGPNPDFPDEWDPSPQEEFRELWGSLHGVDSWDANPEVVALTFTVHKTNIDAMLVEALAP